MAAGFVYGFAVVLAVVGGLELIDRTSFALIGLATRLRPLGAWLGGASAFVATTVLAVAVGSALEGLLGAGRVGWLRIAGGLFLIGYASWTLLAAPESEPAVRTDLRGAFAAAFVTIFLLELGDTTMIFEIVFVPSFGWLAVLAGGAVGLVTVAAWDVWIGGRIGLRLSPTTVRRVVAAILYAVGALTVLYGLAPSVFPVLGLGVA
jgi:putative Ca2+/H+ antiporter (TMEM165/GDT1 family)